MNRVPIVILALTVLLLGSAGTARANTATQLPFSNQNGAWLTVDPAGGHVFVSGGPGTSSIVVLDYAGAIVNTITGEGGASQMALDPATHTLYVGTDFGVLQGTNDGAHWHVTRGMPRYEIMHLEIQPSNRAPTCMGGGHCRRILYAATHSQGIWKMRLGG